MEKIIQISAASDGVYVLSEDGSVYLIDRRGLINIMFKKNDTE